jgi:hypothetical protein
MNIYRKPTTTDTTIHYNSNHPMEHKMAAYRFLLNRVHQLPITQEYKEQEMNTIYQIAKKNGYTTTIAKLNTQIIIKNQNKTKHKAIHQHNKLTKKRIIFEYHSPIIKKITNIFKNTNLHITCRVRNTTQRLLKTYNTNQSIYTYSGIYSLRCNSCNKEYVGQTGSNMRQRYSEHHRYIKTNDPKSAYALHILNNKHEYGTIQSTMKLLKICKKGWRMNTLEKFYMQKQQQDGTRIQKQIPGKENPLFRIIIPTHPNAHEQRQDS